MDWSQHILPLDVSGALNIFMKAPGVNETAVGFMGGHVDHPTYEQVSKTQDI